MGTADAQPNVQFLSSKARYWQHHGRPDLATKAWEQVLLEDPRDVTALAQLSILAKENADEAKAKHYLEQIKSIAPASPDIAQVETILRQNPQFQHLVAEAAAQDQRGDYDAAVRLYRQAIGPGDPPPDLASGYFFALSKTAGGKEKAIRELQSLAKGHPAIPQYDLVLGQLLTYTPATRQKGVEILSRLALGQTALATQARISWRHALTWEGANPGAIPLIRSYIAHFPDPALTAQLSKAEAAATAIARGKEQAARGAITAREAAARRLVVAQEQAGYAALHHGKLTIAEQIFQKLLASNPNNPHYLEALADICMAQQHFPEAIALAQQALAVAPADRHQPILALIQQAKLFATLQLANKAATGHHVSLAIHYFQKALEQNPDNLAALEGLAGEYESIKNYDQAINVYHRALGVAPSKASLWVGMLGALHSACQDTQALQFAENAPASLLIRLQKNPVWWANLGEVYAGLKNGVEAQSALGQAVRLSKRFDPNVQIQLAWVLYNNGEYDRLQDVLQRLMAVPLSPEQNAQVGDIVVLDGERRATDALKTGDETRARTILDGLAARYPNNISLRQAFANLQIQTAWRLYKSGNDLALYHILIALRKNPQLDPVQRHQVDEIFRYAADREAGASLKADDYQSAAAIYRNMMRLFPDQAHYRRQLANVYLAAGQPKDALLLFRQVGPGDSAASYAAAIGAAWGSGDLEQAEQWVNQGLKRWPEDINLLKLSAQIADARGERLQALTEYQKTLRILDREIPNAAVSVPAQETSPQTLPPFAGADHG